MQATFDVSTLPVLIFRFIGTKSLIIQHPQKGKFTNSRVCSIFVYNLIEGKKHVRMTILSINSRESIHKPTCFFVLSDLRIRGFRTGNFD